MTDSNNIPLQKPLADAPRSLWRSLSQQSRYLLGIALLAVPLFFIGLGSWGFFDPDEGRYAAIPREMVLRHDFITPTLNYFKYFEKPPLFYWAVAGAYKIFGFHEWAARLVPAVAALIGVFAAYFLGRRMFGARAGFLGAIALSTSALWMFLARFLVIDMLVSVLIFLALTSWWLGHTEEKLSAARLYFLGFWASLALAVLTKGPMAVVLVGATIFIYTALCKNWRAWTKMQWLLGVPLFLLITAPWFILVAARNAEFNHFFWYIQHVGRFLGTGKVEHRHPVYWFVELLPGLLFPWSFLMPGALFAAREKWPQLGDEKRRAVVFLLGGTAFILGFFSASSSKLVTYILPIFPLIAVLMGAYLDWLFRHPQRIWRGWFRGGAWALSALIGVVAVAAVIVGPRALLKAEALPKSYVLLLGALLLGWALLLGLATMRRHYAGLIGAVAGGVAAFMMALLPLISAAAPNHIVRPLVDYIRPGLQAGGELAMFETLSQSSGYYAGARVPMIRRHEDIVMGELSELPLKTQNFSPAEGERWIPVGFAALKRHMARAQPFYFLITDHNAAAEIMSNLGPGAQEIIWNKRRSIIGNAAAAAITPPLPGGLLSMHGYAPRKVVISPKNPKGTP